MNFLNFIFVNFAFFILLNGCLINIIESYLPTFIIQMFRYGKMAHKGKKNPFVSLIEVPKNWFSHMYVFALFWSIGWSCLVVRTNILNVQPPPGIFLDFLNLVTGSSERAIEVTATECFVVMMIFTLQCIRRFHDTHFVQIFSSTSKINAAHYVVGFAHYFAVILGIIANAEGFVPGSHSQAIQLSQLSTIQILGITLFLYSWLQQYRSNIILANLRKDETGKVITEKHLMPKGGWFELVSSPHMLFEVLMYVALFIIIPNCTTIRYAVVWVLVNQIETAWLTHKWYKETFGSKYPIERKAILPWTL